MILLITGNGAMVQTAQTGEQVAVSVAPCQAGKISFVKLSSAFSE